MIYVAFLRGINVGGSSVIKMSDLKAVFEFLGFKRVVPVLASGNIVFETSKCDLAVLRNQIQDKLAEKFGLATMAIIRDGAQILELIKLNPFKGIPITANAKLHVTFLADLARRFPKLPSKVSSPEFQIVRCTKGAVCSVVEPSPTAGTPELMKLLESELGKQITTRTWNTIQNIGRVIESANSSKIARVTG